MNSMFSADELVLMARSQAEQAAAYIRERIGALPQVGIILGSGLNDFEKVVASATALPYGDIPFFPVPQVEGHRGRLVIGELSGHQVAVMVGRAHYYEGYSMQEVTLPLRVLRLLGVRVLIVTNAAGGLNTQFCVGDLMLITDHINLPGMTAHNPLRGPNDPLLGPRFPDMTNAYDAELRRIAWDVARERNLPTREGVYVMLSGPSFETPAEIRFLRLIGGDSVGMSTAHEVVVARHAGMRVLGISTISNVAAGDPAGRGDLVAGAVTHEEVLQAGALIVPRLSALIQGFLSQLRLGQGS
jgi:purine-nucleoside phosphorylase